MIGKIFVAAVGLSSFGSRGGMNCVPPVCHTRHSAIMRGMEKLAT